MTRVKISKMNIQELSWCVATITQPDWVSKGLLKVFPDDLEMDNGQMYLPASNFSQGAELLSQEGISVVCEGGVWTAYIDMAGDRESVQTGQTMLEAGMRTFLDIFNDGAYMDIPYFEDASTSSPSAAQEVGDLASCEDDNDNFRIVDESSQIPLFA